MILAVSRFRVANGLEGDVRAAFLARPRLVDAAPGFLGMETWTDAADPTVFHLVTRWTDEESFRAWHRGPDHHRSHDGIPRGLKLDASFTRLTVLERVEPEAGGACPEERVHDRAPLLARFLAESSHVHHLEMSPEGTVRHANAAACATFGETAEGLRGRSLWDLVGPDAASVLRGRVDMGLPGPHDRFLLNLVVGERRLSLECLLHVRPIGFVLLAEPARGRERSPEEELAHIGNELAVLSRESARRAKSLEHSLAELRSAYWHVRKIQEVLPICMECGRVKTDEDRWAALVDFMKENSLFLSHGVCPDCLPGYRRRMRGHPEETE